MIAAMLGSCVLRICKVHGIRAQELCVDGHAVGTRGPDDVFLAQ